ncbi:uncharacterized protein Eint_110490 [Encephalitozoon intestinalis ATCC 50506]|uniref:Uncharacterized protein n=1 Tax=Encephalitozoon intestinalis (strain ATCC 50506) TaxID=876142 RepID=E0SAC4_ENCIT|nr:uncharacterized protein Eint_110490 [Encephalitozoon intestinalis ATCC 50506]ADM12549.1 hypothetical protein Eint_110490 [Encephalitozoon intestinalis ATCC 50506]UTX46405.1 hypothetical protein GPK93_11g20120 [Encephalitozoon intestinalis]
MIDANNEKKSQSKQLCPIKIPLAGPLKDMIGREVGDKASTVIDILEGVVPTVSPEDMYSELVEALSPVVDQKAKGLVGKVMAYKRKTCRDGDECKAKNCIFLHSWDRKSGEGSVQTGSKGREEGIDSGEVTGKRRRTNESNENNEVVFNKVNESRHNPENLKAYAARFGKVVNFKRLNPEKYLVVFEDPESASELVKSSEPVLEDFGIKKFYNVIDNLVKVELKKLFEEQETVIDKMSTEFSAALLGHLRNINIRIRNLVLKEKLKDGTGTDNKRGFDQENSLYYNCF